jgi:hypothetical protein
MLKIKVTTPEVCVEFEYNDTILTSTAIEHTVQIINEATSATLDIKGTKQKQQGNIVA